MIANLIRLNRTPPEPSLKHPYVQLEWIWERFLCRFRSKKTIEGGRARLAAYKRFLSQANGNDERLKNDPKFFIAIHWDYFAIHNAEKFWRAAGYSTATIHSYVKGLRSVIDFAVAEGLTSVTEFMYPQVKVTRETKTREAYSDAELEPVRKLITETTLKASRYANGYLKKGIGSDPRNIGEYVNGDHNLGWSDWDNMVWYFENVMDCKALTERQIKSRRAENVQRQFILAARIYHGGLPAVWEKLGVPLIIGSDLIITLAMKLAWETGLNPGSILNLKRDCYGEEHQLSGLPFIRYYKERSTGEKELHLLLLDDSKEDTLHLLPKQSEIVARTIKLILQLTEPLVGKALPHDKNLLLLFESFNRLGPNISKDGVMRVDKGALQSWSAATRKKLMTFGDENIQILNLARFRATKITQMVRDGHDFFRVQAVAGHASIRTTARYLADYQLEAQAQREVTTALIQIQRNAQEYNKSPKSYASGGEKYIPEVIYKGVMSDCKNPFDPPKSVRGLKSYEVGQLCTYWNMCLLCPNVIITRKHLPLLITYDREIKISLKDKNLTQAPHIIHYRKSAAILGEIFREFTEEDVRWAATIAEGSDTFIDGVTYHGVEG